MHRALLLALLSTPALAQAGLHQQLETIAAQARGQVSIACALPGTPLDCNLNPAAHPPMQSVFKLPLSLAVLHQVEQGKFTLDQPIRFLSSDRIPPENWSPLEKEHPAANIDVPLRHLLELTVNQSDNTAADILLRLLGGPSAVNAYMASLGITGFHLEHTEHDLHRDGTLQYRDWFEPRAAVHLLRHLASEAPDHSPLTPGDTALLLTWMHSTSRIQRLQADLPPGTIVAHKSGSSGSTDGLAPATNDIGLINLPGGRRLAVAIFLTDSRADDPTRDRIIAQLAHTLYLAATAPQPPQ